MTLTESQANFLLHIASGRVPVGVPVPYGKAHEADAVALEKMGLVERHHVAADKGGACFTAKGAQAFAAILQSVQ